MNEIEGQATGDDMRSMVAVLSLFGAITALAAVFAAFLLPPPWSTIVAVVSILVAGGCLGAAVSVARSRQNGDTS